MAVDERDLRYIDSDGHILEHPTAMLEYAPAEYRDRIWHIETDADGTECSMWNGRRMPSTGLAGTAGFPDDEVEQVRRGELTYTTTRPSGWTASLRLEDMDTDGIDLVGPLPDDDARAPEPARRRVRARPGAGRTTTGVPRT